MHAFVIHDQAFALEQNMQAPVAEASADGGVGLQPRPDSKVGRVGPAPIAPRRRTEPDDPTGPSQTRAARLQPPHRLAPSDGAYHFFATTALSA
jgi:hypothetical protein